MHILSKTNSPSHASIILSESSSRGSILYAINAEPTDSSIENAGPTTTLLESGRISEAYGCFLGRGNPAQVSSS